MGTLKTTLSRSNTDTNPDTAGDYTFTCSTNCVLLPIDSSKPNQGYYYLAFEADASTGDHYYRWVQTDGGVGVRNVEDNNSTSDWNIGDGCARALRARRL